MKAVRQPDLGDVFAARKRIGGLVRRTPLVKAEELSLVLGSDVYLKLECLQITGSFKARGAANRLLSLTGEERRRGVVAFSTGNHGRAVAALSRELGIPAVICLSTRVPRYRLEAMRVFGAEIAAYGQSQDEAYLKALEIQKERGLTMVAPFDDPYVIAGQGTIALEIMEELPETAQVVVPLSGGGLFAGVALAAKTISGSIKAAGVSMAVAPAMIRSLEAGRPVEIEEKDSLADALLGGVGLDNAHTFELTRRYIDQTVLVSESEIAAGMFHAFDKSRLAVEGSGAVGISAILAGRIEKSSGPTVVVVSGQNASPGFLSGLFAEHYKQERTL
ncbi:MAG: hydroxyectoine utilization dehydratase EutB [Candidatus Adiutrix sp.]|jgi:threonine dehydratase|nr:hydroxyectoine utilization dehydratase EutB [Candidatus Adiutrix sp.]